MARLTLAHCAASDIPEIIGACPRDIPAIANAVNRAQDRLIFAKESGDEGWHGSWAEMGFNVLRCDPYIALGRYGARLMEVDVCGKPIQINNQFEEYLRFGNGRQLERAVTGRTWCREARVYARGMSPTYRDMTPGHVIRIRAIDPLDTSGDKRVLIQGTNTSDHTVSSLDGAIRVQGIYLNVLSPFVDTPFPFNSITGIQKDATSGAIEFWDVDPVTAAERLILVMEGGELVAGYTRYYLKGLPLSCCHVTEICGQATVQVTAMVKLNVIPVVVPTDYLIIQCMEAIISECQSMRYAKQDLPASKSMSAAAHKDAVRYLNGELTHYYGTQTPAISVLPFGSAKLEHQGIGLLI